MSNTFLGAGWNFPVRLDAAGQVDRARYEDSIYQAVWMILSTAPGERAMRPDFGCGIYDLVFSVSDTATWSQAAQAVRQALLRWEPRIELVTVEVAPQPDKPYTLLIRVSYQVRATNNRFNLVYPFYLE